MNIIPNGWIFIGGAVSAWIAVIYLAREVIA